MRSPRLNTGDISNDVGDVKRHIRPFRPPEPALTSQEPAEAAVSQAVKRFRMSTLNARILTASLTVLPTKHLFGHNGTMMTRANSREGRRVAYSFCRSRSADHISTQASPHTGITAPSLVMERDGRTPRSRSDRVTESTVGCRASAPTATRALPSPFCCSFRR